jgi:hypothetical protein
MFGQKFTNTNEMLQCGRIHCADFGGPKLGELNTALHTADIELIGTCLQSGFGDVGGKEERTHLENPP